MPARTAPARTAPAWTAFVLLLLATPAGAQEAAALKPGPGQDVTQTVCGACHTTNYIAMNSPFLTAAAWTAEVAKMRTAFGAPMDDAQAAEIVKYLAANYGPPG